MGQERAGKGILVEEPDKKERPRDFGSLESEDMLIKFLPRFIPGVARAERASWFDDENNSVDVVAHLENGKKLAIQWTITDSPERRQEKVRNLMRGPFTFLHSEEGEVVSEERVLRVLLYMDKKQWAKAWEKGGGDAVNAILSLKEPEELGLKLVDTICINIAFLLESVRSIGNEERRVMGQIAQFLRGKIEHLKVPTAW